MSVLWRMKGETMAPLNRIVTVEMHGGKRVKSKVYFGDGVRVLIERLSMDLERAE